MDKMNKKESIQTELSALSTSVQALLGKASGGYTMPDSYNSELKEHLVASSTMPSGVQSYGIPDGYFESLGEIIESKTQEKQIAQVVPMWRRPLVVGMAASLVLMVGYFGVFSSSSTTDTIEPTMMTAELAYITDNIDDVSYEELYSYDVAVYDQSDLIDNNTTMSDDLLIDQLIDDLSDEDIMNLF